MYYVIAIIAILIAFFMIKKAVGCAIKAIIGAILLAILVFVYYKVKFG